MPVPTINGIAITLRKFHVCPVTATTAFTSASEIKSTEMLMAASRNDRKIPTSVSSSTAVAGRKIMRKSFFTRGCNTA